MTDPPSTQFDEWRDRAGTTHGELFLRFVELGGNHPVGYTDGDGPPDP